MRCLQTAAVIASYSDVHQLHVNYLLCEWLEAKFYPEGNPIDRLLISKFTPHEYVKKYLGAGLI